MSGTANFTVTTGELGKASKKLEELSTSYEQVYKKLIQQAETMGKAYEAPDNLDFVAQIKGFCEELAAMATKLKTGSETLNTQKTNYETQSQNNSAAVKKLTN